MKKLFLLALLLPQICLGAVALTQKASAVLNASANNFTSGAFSTAGSSLVVIGIGWADNVSNTVSTVVVNGTGGGSATASAAKREDCHGVGCPSTGTWSGEQIWYYWASSALASSTVTVTFVGVAAAPFASMDVVEATGTDANSSGSTGSSFSDSNATAAVSVVTSVDASVPYGGCSTSLVTWTAGTNTTEILETTDTNGDGYFWANNTQATTSGNTYTITETNASAASFSCMVVEVKPAASAASNLTRTLMGVGQ